jgi:hypothetical protein
LAWIFSQDPEDIKLDFDSSDFGVLGVPHRWSGLLPVTQGQATLHRDSQFQRSRQLWIANIIGSRLFQAPRGSHPVPCANIPCGAAQTEAAGGLENAKPGNLRPREPDKWVLTEISVQLDAMDAPGPSTSNKQEDKIRELRNNNSVHNSGHRRCLISKARDLSESKTRPAHCFARCLFLEIAALRCREHEMRTSGC